MNRRDRIFDAYTRWVERNRRRPEWQKWVVVILGVILILRAVASVHITVG